jgi:hypothetical protein
MAETLIDRSNLHDLPVSFLGIEDHIVVQPGGTGFGYREPDGRIFIVWDRHAAFTKDQIGKVLAAARIPLPGWPDGVPANWLDQPQWSIHCPHPKRFVSCVEVEAVECGLETVHGMVARPTSVRRSFDRLLLHTNSVLSSLVRPAQIEELRTKAKKLKAASLNPAVASLDKHFGEINATIKQHVARLDFSADCFNRKTIDRPLDYITPELVHCFETVFCGAATGGWKKRRKTSADDADSPYVRFAQAFLSEVGCPYRPLSIQRALYDSRKSLL